MTAARTVRTVRPARLPASVAATLALAVVGLGFGAGQAHAARGMEIGIQDDSVFVTKKGMDRELAFAKVAKLGVTRLRINVQWAFTLTPDQRNATSPPAGLRYHFELVDDAIDAAARHGIRTYLTLTGPAPAWATSNHTVGPRRPNAAFFGQFAAIAALHFKGRVNQYSIWNEPNIRTWLGPINAAPGLYRKLYKSGYDAIKSQDPGAKVLFGELAPYSLKFSGRPFASSPLAFLRKALCVNKQYKKRKSSCPKLKADGVAHHPYDFRHAPKFKYKGNDNVTLGTLSRLIKALNKLAGSGALRKAGGGRLPLHLTEYGYFSTGPRALPKKLRSKYLFQGWSLALKNSRVKSTYQYLIAAPTGGSSFFNLALFNHKGTKAYPQYKTLVKWFKSHKSKVKRPGGAISLPPAPAS